jgi:ferredoxin-NADP reductase
VTGARDLELQVTRVIRETPDTSTLVLADAAQRFDYEAGQFISIDPHQFAGLAGFTAYLEDQKGRRERPRAYSMASAPHEALAITIKEEPYVSGVTRYPPLLSPFLTRHVAPGASVLATGFTGGYTLPKEVETCTGHVVHLCAGSGIVPNFSILKHSLRTHPRLEHSLIYSNKTRDDSIWRAALRELERHHPKRFRLIERFTREPGASAGRIDFELVRSVLRDPTSDLVYACGPAITSFERKAARTAGRTPEPRFLEAITEYVLRAGVPKDHFWREWYG